MIKPSGPCRGAYTGQGGRLALLVGLDDAQDEYGRRGEDSENRVQPPADQNNGQSELAINYLLMSPLFWRTTQIIRCLSRNAAGIFRNIGGIRLFVDTQLLVVTVLGENRLREIINPGRQ